jgi:chemotaxis protein methyltransferase CheR
VKDSQCVEFLQWALPHLRMRWPGFRKVRKQVGRRIDRRIRELGLLDLSAYRNYLQMNPAEWSVLDSFCRISISRFYRDRGVFDYLRDEILPALAALARSSDHTLRCWSAGCASGEEAYTLSILWKLDLATRFPDVVLEVIATDIDPHMLVRAERGGYSMSSLKDCPQNWLRAAFVESDELYCVKPEFRGPVQFFLQDIRREMPDGMFQLILCRHVALTYFDEPLQQTILQRILSRLVPGGVLVTGKQEPLPIASSELQECAPHMGCYQKS